ncbi:MAG: hypothetical protein JEZ14_20215 [Marinilabiliaceae bacterium]|nr:hypothetical protein [Marinilabiliaceae bacterium]
MGRKTKHSEVAILDQYGIALQNAEEQPVIATSMAEMGYDAPTIATGKSLYNDARQVFKRNKVEDDETKAAYQQFDRTRKALTELYRLHRKKAKIVFKNEPLILNKLAIDKGLPKSYVNWVEVVLKFYNELTADEALRTLMARLKVPDEEIAEGANYVLQLKDDRANYRREVGESEEVTKLKDAAMAEIDSWMSEFYAVARIALEDQPQLLEALGKQVKS